MGRRTQCCQSTHSSKWSRQTPQSFLDTPLGLQIEKEGLYNVFKHKLKVYYFTTTNIVLLLGFMVKRASSAV